MTSYVYRAFDPDDRLLYVGRASTARGFKYRLRSHRARAPWWPLHSHLVLEPFNTFREAAVAELVAIRTEHPRWNVSDRSPDHPDGMIQRHEGIRRAPWLRDEIAAWEVWRRTEGRAA